MPATRETPPHCLWRALLVTFILYAVDGIASAGDGTPAFEVEQETKAACLEPGTDDTPAIQHWNPGDQAADPAADRAPARDRRFARNKSEQLNLIRGPPSGQPAPA